MFGHLLISEMLASAERKKTCPKTDCLEYTVRKWNREDSRKRNVTGSVYPDRDGF